MKYLFRIKFIEQTKVSEIGNYTFDILVEAVDMQEAEKFAEYLHSRIKRDYNGLSYEVTRE